VKTDPEINKTVTPGTLFYDQVTIVRIASAHPKLRDELKDLYMECNNKIVPKGKRLRFTHVLRTFAEQEALYALGRTKPGKRVTNARGGQSFHNYGLAFDIVILEDRDGNGTFETANWDVNALWKEVASFFKSKGWEWGGDWKSFKDYPHFQKTFGKTTAELLKMVKETGGTYPNI
jgi:peptidoglycan L-alanyl-D-glutamate endopeptidase CwlK